MDSENLFTTNKKTPIMKASFMMAINTVKVLRFLIMETPTKALILKTSSKDKANTHGKIPLSIKEPSCKDLNMDLGY
jgi:hypothetical protein